MITSFRTSPIKPWDIWWIKAALFLNCIYKMHLGYGATLHLLLWTTFFPHKTCSSCLKILKHYLRHMFLDWSHDTEMHLKTDKIIHLNYKWTIKCIFCWSYNVYSSIILFHIQLNTLKCIFFSPAKFHLKLKNLNALKCMFFWVIFIHHFLFP